MTYIWNRMDRVPKDLMPKVVQDAFNEWIKEQYKNFDKLIEEEKTKINFKVSKQMGQMEYNLKQLGYK
jgi:hypothetical protein